jgi:hypothetical protein
MVVEIEEGNFHDAVPPLPPAARRASAALLLDLIKLGAAAGRRRAQANGEQEKGASSGLDRGRTARCSVIWRIQLGPARLHVSASLVWSPSCGTLVAHYLPEAARATHCQNVPEFISRCSHITLAPVGTTLANEKRAHIFESDI